MRFLPLLLFTATSIFATDLGVDTHFDQSTGGAPQYNAANVFPVIRAQGYTYYRDDLNWSLFERTQGVYAESPYKQPWIDAAYAQGIKFVACLAYPPGFYNGWDVQATASFAAWLAVDEGPRLAAIEVVNEPNNIAQFQGAIGQTYLVQLTNAVRAAVRAAGSTTPVIGLGEQGSAVLNMLSMNPQIDGVVYHPYDNSNGTTPSIPERVYEPPYSDYETWVQAIRAATKLPIWETERNASNIQYHGEYESAVWNARRLLMSYGLGVEHTFIYQFTDTNPIQSVMGYQLQPRQAMYVVQRLLGALNGLHTIGSKAVATAWDANFAQADYKNYVFTGSSYWSPTVAAVWFGNKQPGHYGQHVPSVVTLNIPQQHPHVGGSVGGTVLDLVSGKVTPIQAAQYTSTGISGITVSDNPVLIILQ